MKFLIPASESNPNLDALGNAISNPRSTKTFNGFGDGEHWELIPSNTVSNTKTIEAFIFYEGRDTVWFDLTGDGNSEIESVNGVLTVAGITSPTIYVNGILKDTLSTGWNLIAITTDTAVDCTAMKGYNIHESFKCYDFVFTIEQVVNNYNAQANIKGLSTI